MHLVRYDAISHLPILGGGCGILAAVSRENVELVTNLQPAPDVDIAKLFRDDDMWSALADAVAPFFHPDFESVAPGVPGTEKLHVGLDGLRAAWLEWMEPWLTYRTEIMQAIDASDRVLLLTHDYGRREGVAQEVKIDGSAVWRLSDGKIARVCFYPARSEAFAAAGLTAPEADKATDGGEKRRPYPQKAASSRASPTGSS